MGNVSEKYGRICIGFCSEPHLITLQFIELHDHSNCNQEFVVLYYFIIIIVGSHKPTTTFFNHFQYRQMMYVVEAAEMKFVRCDQATEIYVSF